ncbi:MAG TPA: hypothetical protein VH853_06070 [Polyangia bacterium]|jgi:hypothetical protein|nr:hypothetical protein [Polyangia bacterium]
MKPLPARLIRTLAIATLCAAACTSNAASKADSGGTGGGTGKDGASDGSGQVASQVVDDGFVTAGPWAGYGFTATDPGAATITPDCSGSAGCLPPFTGNTFCMQGTVTGRADYTGFAMLGWNVNQMDGGAMGTWPIPATGGITVTVSNPGNTALRLQLQGTDPHSGADRWCIPLTSGQLTPWTSFVTNCYTGGTPQTPLTAGTPIEQASILVPGLQTDLPFNLCLVDIQITP